MNTKIILLLVFISIMNFCSYAQSDWELVSRSPYEGFRFYGSSNGLTSILDENNHKLISYHGSAFSGLIVRLTTDLASGNIESQELNWMNPDSPMRGGGFDIQKSWNNNLYLYGIGALKDDCYNTIGVTIFRKKINPTAPTTWNDTNNPIIRKNVYLDGISYYFNNGVADKHGNYFFCSDGTNKHLYVTNIFDNNAPIDLSSNFPEKNYIIKFKKISDGLNTHIIGLESNKKNFVYIRIDASGQYYCNRYSFKDVVSGSNPIELQSISSFDVGIKNQYAELLFLTKSKKLYSINLSLNIVGTLSGKGILKYEAQNNSNMLNKIRGVVYVEDGKCLLIPWGGANFYFDGNHLYQNSFNSIYGIIVDKIYKLNNFNNSKVFLTRQDSDSMDTDFKKIRLYTIDAIINNGVVITKYAPGLNDYLITTNFSHGGGSRIKSLAITGSHLLYDGFDSVNYKDLNSTELLTDNKNLNFNSTSLISINNDEFVAGLYYGPYIQRFRIINNIITPLDFHKINDDFKKIYTMAYDGDNVYIGLYHNGQSNTNISNVYKYNIYNDTTNNNDISTSFISIANTNYIPALKVITDNSNKKWLYGLAQNARNGVFKLFRKNLTDDLPVEEINISINGILRDMEIITAINNNVYLYFITVNSNHTDGDLYRMNISYNQFTSSNIHHLRSFGKMPINIISYLDKHLMIAFNCKKIGYLTQDGNSNILEINELPLPIVYNHDIFIANAIDKYLYYGAHGGIGDNFNNNEGGVFKIKLPEYMSFSFQYRFNWGIHPENILSGDINGDGYDDIIAVTKTNGRYTWNIKTNDGNQHFNNFNSFQLASSDSDFVFIGDFNGDGFDDLGVYNIRILPFSNNDNIHQKKYVGGSQNESDINNMSLYSSRISGEWTFYLNDGAGNFDSHDQIRYNDWRLIPDKISIGDYNGDGYDDIAIFKNNDGWYFKLNNQSMNFDNNVIKYDWANTPDFIFSGDFNGDGYDDIGLKNSNTENPQWVVRFNNQSMSFNNQKRYDWQTYPNYIGIGDFNNDNLEDLCINLHSNPVSMQLGEWVFRLNHGYYFNAGNSRHYNRINNNINDNTKEFVNIYPNPSSNYIFINSKKKIRKIEIRNYNNQLISNKRMYSGNKKINISSLPKGIYYIKLFFKSDYIIKKIIKL